MPPRPLPWPARSCQFLVVHTGEHPEIGRGRWERESDRGEGKEEGREIMMREIREEIIRQNKGREAERTGELQRGEGKIDKKVRERRREGREERSTVNKEERRREEKKKIKGGCVHV